MIVVSKTTTGILIQRDELDIQIDAPAVPLALPTIITSLISDGRAMAAARRESYEAGLTQGYQNAHIAQQTSERIAERQATDLVESLIGFNRANAA
jgi:hypothetical protein